MCMHLCNSLAQAGMKTGPLTACLVIAGHVHILSAYAVGEHAISSRRVALCVISSNVCLQNVESIMTVWFLDG